LYSVDLEIPLIPYWHLISAEQEPVMESEGEAGVSYMNFPSDFPYNSIIICCFWVPLFFIDA
jgi:hypothetical protein